LKNKKPIETDYNLRLFIAGASPNSLRAISNMRSFCEEHLKGRYHLEIVDVYQQPQIATKDQVIALPLLIKSSPLPFKRLIGDMSDKAKVMKGLGLDITINAEYADEG
jgi:circadian clock protein KaiB